MEQETRNGRWRTSLSSFWLLSTPRRSSRDGNRRARRQVERLDEAGLRTPYADRTRRSDQAGRGSRGRSNRRTRGARDTGARHDIGGRL